MNGICVLRRVITKRSRLLVGDFTKSGSSSSLHVKALLPVMYIYGGHLLWYKAAIQHWSHSVYILSAPLDPQSICGGLGRRNGWTLFFYLYLGVWDHLFFTHKKPQPSYTLRNLTVRIHHREKTLNFLINIHFNIGCNNGILLSVIVHHFLTVYPCSIERCSYLPVYDQLVGDSVKLPPSLVT